MKLTNLLPLAALSTAFVLPPSEVMNEIVIEDNHRGNVWYEEAEQAKDDILAGLKKHYTEVTETSKDAWEQITKSSRSAFDDAIEYGNDAADTIKDMIHEAGMLMRNTGIHLSRWPCITAVIRSAGASQRIRLTFRSQVRSTWSLGFVPKATTSTTPSTTRTMAHLTMAHHMMTIHLTVEVLTTHRSMVRQTSRSTSSYQRASTPRSS